MAVGTEQCHRALPWRGPGSRGRILTFFGCSLQHGCGHRGGTQGCQDASAPFVPGCSGTAAAGGAHRQLSVPPPPLRHRPHRSCAARGAPAGRMGRAQPLSLLPRCPSTAFFIRRFSCVLYPARVSIPNKEPRSSRAVEASPCRSLRGSARPSGLRGAPAAPPRYRPRPGAEQDAAHPLPAAARPGGR